MPNLVTNNLIDLDKSLLITGSNMAGKTTFIKTIGINLIFSQSINLCFIQSRNSKTFVKSNIRREDNEDQKLFFWLVDEPLKLDSNF
ncbi:MAG: hypothetical protein H6611_06255 [Ignavibacteriales bacterium]|nr:hypothetical protein [Ignavibacteriales bacterium]